MESQLPDLTPLTTANFNFYTADALPLPADVLQLQVDTANVVEGRVDISTFSPDYQEKILGFYRFCGIRQNTKSHNIARRIRQTLDIVGP